MATIQIEPVLDSIDKIDETVQNLIDLLDRHPEIQNKGLIFGVVFPTFQDFQELVLNNYGDSTYFLWLGNSGLYTQEFIFNYLTNYWKDGIIIGNKEKFIRLFSNQYFTSVQSLWRKTLVLMQDIKGIEFFQNTMTAVGSGNTAMTTEAGSVEQDSQNTQRESNMNTQNTHNSSQSAGAKLRQETQWEPGSEFITNKEYDNGSSGTTTSGTSGSTAQITKNSNSDTTTNRNSQTQTTTVNLQSSFKKLINSGFDTYLEVFVREFRHLFISTRGMKKLY